MFNKGVPITVIVDDSLQFKEKNSLIYASSLRTNKFFKPSSDLTVCNRLNTGRNF